MSHLFKPLRSWRLSQPEAHGLSVWFDLMIESVLLRDLTDTERASMVDKLSSVSGLDEDEDDGYTQENEGDQLVLIPSFFSKE